MTNRINIQEVLADSRFRKKLLEAASNFLQELSKEPPHEAPQTQEDHIKNPCCPACREGNCEGGFIDVDGVLAYQHMNCPECDATWTDVYSLTGYADLTLSEED